MSKKSVNELLSDAQEVYGVFGKSQRAIVIVDEVLGIEPDNVQALNLKASILYELDRDDEALEFHRKALAVEPDSIEAMHGIASMANDRFEYKESIKWLDRAFRSIDKDPYPEFRENEDYRQRLIAELYNEKAFALWYLGKKGEAADLLTEEAPKACPLEIETFEDELDWLEHHPENPND